MIFRVNDESKFVHNSRVVPFVHCDAVAFRIGYASGGDAPANRHLLAWFVCVVAILLGVALVGVSFVPSFCRCPTKRIGTKHEVGRLDRVPKTPARHARVANEQIRDPSTRIQTRKCRSSVDYCCNNPNSSLHPPSFGDQIGGSMFSRRIRYHALRLQAIRLILSRVCLKSS